MLSLLLLHLPAVAQQNLRFSILSFEKDEFDGSAKNPDYGKFDGNGDRYAIIKVSAENPDDDLREFQYNFGSMNHLTETVDGQIWIYVQKNAKYITITRNGYQPVNKYPLEESIREGTVYNMVLTLDRIRKEVVYDVKMQMLKFHVTPSSENSIVTLKNTDTGVETVMGGTDSQGYVSKAMPYGRYNYKVMSGSNLYYVAEGMVTLNSSDNVLTEDVTLHPNFGEITLKASENVQIYINNEPQGVGQWKGRLSAGRYVITCRKPNHRDSQQRITVEEGDMEVYTLPDPTPITGSLAVNGSPDGAAIQIDGRPYGEAPRLIKDIVIGEHTVTLTHEGYSPATEHVLVTEGEVTSVEMQLLSIANFTFTTQPQGAFIYIDDRAYGAAPVSVTLSSGQYRITANKTGYKHYSKTHHLKASDTEVKIRMTPLMMKKNGGYLELNATTQSYTSAGATLGFYGGNVNFEFAGSFGFDKSEEIYWCTGITEPESAHYSPMLNLTGKMGYGIIIANRMRITPQVGVGFTKLWESMETGYSNIADAANTVNALASLRLSVALTKGFVISATPEYALPVKKSKGYELLSDVSPTIEKWNNGLNIKFGVGLLF